MDEKKVNETNDLTEEELDEVAGGMTHRPRSTAEKKIHVQCKTCPNMIWTTKDDEVRMCNSCRRKYGIAILL